MSNLMYVLHEKGVYPEPDVLKWARWFNTANRTIKRTTLSDGVVISTVFLGINHGTDETPLFFETMVFGGKHDGDMYRYSLYVEAEMNHDAIVKQLEDEEVEIERTS